MPVLWRAKDPEELVRLRKKVCGQAATGVTPITAWRIENGKPCKEENAKTYYAGLRQTKLGFKSLFEVAADDDYVGWVRVGDAASRVGKHLFGKPFGATAVVTYAGPSALFASFVMAKTLPAGGALLTTPVHLAMHMSRRAFAKIREVPKSFTVLEESEDQEKADQCVVLVPNALKQDDPQCKYKIAIIDDVIMTGRPLRLLKTFLTKTRGYKADHIKVGCCVCHEMTLLRRDETTPAVYGFSTESKSVRFPWGDGIFFPRPKL